MNNIAIRIKGLNKSYGKTAAVRDLDLEVESGAVYGFLGPNGAGKTTVIKMLLGLAMPDSGEVEIFGDDLFRNRESVMKEVGAVVEAPAFFDYMTAYENLYYLTRLSGFVSKEMIKSTLTAVGLENVIDMKTGTFSYGMKQRLGIAQALLPKNRLIFLDEPTNGLDPHGILGVRRLIRGLCDKYGKTVFISSHLLSEVEQICDFVAIIDKGRKICESKVSDLVNRYQRIEIITEDRKELLRLVKSEKIELSEEKQGETGSVFMINGNEKMIPDLLKKLVAAEIRISKAAMHNETLEEVFIELTGKDKTDFLLDRF